MIDEGIQANETKQYQSRRSSHFIKSRLDNIISEKAERIAEIFEKMMAQST